MEQGIYKIYRTHLDSQGVPGYRLAARLLVNNGFAHYLEDDDNVSRILEPGEIDAKKERRFDSMRGNAYFKVLHEDDLNAGHHPEHLQVMDLGETCPEASFDLIYSGSKHLLEVYAGGATILDGRTLSDDETKMLMSEISDKKKLLEPRG